MKNSAILLLGGNIGSTGSYFVAICDQMEKNDIHILKKSSLYSSPPWGFKAEQDFLNQALLVESELNENELLELILKMENSFGRERKGENGNYKSRIIDIDILSHGNRICNEKNLTLPHPRLHQRKFALLPLQEIVPEWKHPVFGKTVNELMEECEDNSSVKIVAE